MSLRAKYGYLLGLLLGTLLGTLLAARPAAARTLLVGKGRPYARLLPALTAARTGDTVRVGPGTYAEGNLVVRQGLVLLGEGWPVLDGLNRHELLTVKAHGFELRGFVLRNSGRGSMIDYAAVKVFDSRDVAIVGNRIENCFFGIYFSGCFRGRATHNQLIGNSERHTQNQSGNGLHLWRCRQMLLQANRVSGHRDGIYFEFVTDSRIVNNHSEGNLRYGLHFMFSHQNTYRANTFQRNGAGVAVMYSHHVVIRDNRFLDNHGASSYGLLLKEISDSEVAGNIFRGNTTGIQLETSSRCQLLGNTITQNGWGVRMTASCDDNLLADNAFTGNTFDLVTNGSLVLNTLRGNYWDRYQGYDLDRDGRGDVPYRPVSAFSYVVEQAPSAIAFLRSPLVDMLDRTERLIPSLTPAALIDSFPQFKR